MGFKFPDYAQLRYYVKLNNRNPIYPYIPMD